jgi:hypothetical protein
MQGWFDVFLSAEIERNIFGVSDLFDLIGIGRR